MIGALLILAGLAIVFMPFVRALNRYGWDDPGYALDQMFFDMSLPEYFLTLTIVRLGSATIFLGLFVQLAMRWHVP